MNLLEALLGLFLRFEYAVVFLVVMAENVGVPLPGETILLAVGLFASQGHFHLWTIILCASVRAMLGDNAGYMLGWKVARPFMCRHGRFPLLTRPACKPWGDSLGGTGTKPSSMPDSSLGLG